MISKCFEKYQQFFCFVKIILHTLKLNVMTSHQGPSLFEQIRKSDDNGNEFWSARDLAKVLEYTEYRNFKPVIKKAKEACQQSGQLVDNHFVHLHEMVVIGSGANRELESAKLSRYACYLIVQNADPAKEVVALGQTYFAVQTRLQEIRQMEEYNQLNTINDSNSPVFINCKRFQKILVRKFA